MKYRFFFDYIFYRVTKAYFKWDGRTGATGLAAITMIQIFLLIDVFVILSRAFLDRYFFAPYANQVGVFFFVAIIGLMIFNYRKYNGTYNKLKSRWKDESTKVTRLKGLLVILSIVLPWVPLIVIGIVS